MSKDLTATRREACGDLGKSIPDRGHSLCRSPKVGSYLAGLGSNEKAHVAEAEQATGR